MQIVILAEKFLTLGATVGLNFFWDGNRRESLGVVIFFPARELFRIC